MRGDRNGWALLAVALLILAAFAIKGVLMIPPGPPATAAPGTFDTARAVGRLQGILGDERPHPVDSAANDAVRGRLIAELRGLGLAPMVRDTIDCSDFPKVRYVRCSRLRNVVAVLDGPAGPALLLNSHYDSSPAGPGAADDGIGIATMLEVAAVMKDRPRARPIILLFNESEEFGLNGASAFVEQDPLARTVGSLINIEARGVGGPALMFETSRPNGPAIADFAAATRRPYANSLSTDFATLIPNTTDVVKFRPAGWEILNYAIIGNETRYHSPGDTIAALDRRSLHHMGSEVLAATQHLASDARSGTSGTAVYADVGGRVFLHLPLPLAAATLGLLLVAALALCWWRRAWRALGLVSLAWAAAAIAGFGAAWLSGFVRVGDYWRAWPLIPNLAAYATALAVLVLLLPSIARRSDRSILRLASWTLALLIGAAASLFLPGASIYFLVGPASALVGIALAPRHHAIGRGLAIAGGLVQLLMFAEMLALIELLLVDGPLAAGTPLAALAAMPVLAEAARGANRIGAWASMALALGLWIAALLVPRASAERPLAFAVDYVRDDVRGTSQWSINAKAAPLPATVQRFGPWRYDELAYNERMRWLAKAPPLDVPAARIWVAGTGKSEGGRLVVFRFDANGANTVTLRFDKDVPILALGTPFQLRPLDRSGTAQRSALACAGRSCGGMDLAVLIGSDEPVEATIISQSYAAPRQAAPLIAGAPPRSQPQYSPHGAVRITGTTL